MVTETETHLIFACTTEIVISRIADFSQWWLVESLCSVKWLTTAS